MVDPYFCLILLSLLSRECRFPQLPQMQCVALMLATLSCHCMKIIILTHWGRVTHTCVSKLTIIGTDNGLPPAPSQYLNQYWNIVNSNFRNRRQWNRKRNSQISIQRNAFENVVCEMAATLSRPQCVKPKWKPSISVIIEIIVGFFIRGLSHSEMSRITSVPQCGISKVLRHVRYLVIPAVLPLFTKRTYVLPQDLVKSRNREIRV